MSDQERLQKQIYLRDEIIQKGYDGEKFQEFLESKKENGTTDTHTGPRSHAHINIYHRIISALFPFPRVCARTRGPTDPP